MISSLKNSLQKLKIYCETENFAGWDPYDGLNSKVFQVLPLKHWDVARLAWIQGFKRSPINLRNFLLVPKQHNSKGVALFLLGYCRLYESAIKGETEFGTLEEILEKIKDLTQLLLDLKVEGYAGACWGYNFDWQARRLFLFKKNTPTVVATAFCVEALVESYKITQNKKVLEVALSSAEFVLKDLSRTPHGQGHIFSYSVKDGNNTVINASLLGAKILSYAYKYKKKQTDLDMAKKAVLAACDLQEDDGSWIYGLLPMQSWKDSFHTGYNLDAISVYQNCTGDNQFNTNLEKGFKYYISNYFENDGTPKYYHNRMFPIDIHCPGQLFVTLSKLDKFKKNQDLAKKVLKWTINNFQSRKGYFYYQLRKGWSSKISYMRWSNAFMFNALTCYLLEKDNKYFNLKSRNY